MEEVKAYTAVLKGVIALSTVVFPTGTTGPALDVLARVALWRGGLDYRHGTGHGVGAPLCVHEGPHYIGNAIARSEKAPAGLRTTLVPGMLVTNEPGYYKEGAFGIRIENVMLVKETEIPDLVNGGKHMFGFDTLTVIPICKKLIDKSMLTKDEIEWFDNYHRRVLDTHAANLTAEELKWLEQQCSPL
jgi:Xaa-Pro aminopeptidase